MSELEMSELDKLLAWMKHNGYTRPLLAEAIGMSYDGLTQILHVRRKLSAGFKLRFIERFGHEVANTIFETRVPA